MLANTSPDLRKANRVKNQSRTKRSKSRSNKAVVEWEKYNPSLFVARDEVRDQIYAYTKSTGYKNQHVISIIAPPGTGKTWFLEHFRDHLKGRQHVVIWVDVSGLVNPAQGIDSENTRLWLNNVVQDATNYCNQTPTFDIAGVEISRIIELLVEYLCDVCTSSSISYIIVDGYDDFQREYLEILESKILEKFLSKDCTRIIIGRRDDQRLWNHRLRGNEKTFVLDVFTDVDVVATSSAAYQQFVKFRDTCYQDSNLILENIKIKSKLSTYKWDHPYINAFLFNKLLETSDKSGKLRELSSKELYECCKSLINRPKQSSGIPARYPALSDEHFKTLKMIASKFPKEDWTAENLERTVGIKFFQDERIELFCQCKVIVSCEDKGKLQRYRVADGLRELLYDLAEMEGRS